MSEKKAVETHTPGPWLSAAEYITAGSSTIARMFPGTGNEDANARLIAAAPDLLEALEWVNVWLEHGEFRPDHKEEGETIRTAIEKALVKARGAEND